MYDIIIKNGYIIDGCGQPGRRGDVGVIGESIEEIGECAAHQGKRVIDAEGQVVAPGFIDIHSHSDFTLLADPGAESKVCQGVTTELVGQCGVSGAPLEGEVLKRRKEELAALGLDASWSTMEEYFQRLQQARPIVNIATLAGHGNLRGVAVGYENRAPSKAELDRMKDMLLQCLEAGAFGMSTGLIYPPGIYSSRAELETLAALVAQFHGIYATHLRSEGDELEESLKEAIALASETGVSLQISHLKTYGKRNWKKLPSVFQIIDDARRRGLDVHADRYPYTASSTDLDVLLPSWVHEGGREQTLRRLEDPGNQERMTEEILSQEPEPEFWDKVVISSVAHEENRKWEGQTLAEISAQAGSAPWQVLYEVLRKEKLRVGAIFSFMSEENLRRILAKDYVMIGSDSAARSVSGILRKGNPHPRGFGTYPRMLHRWSLDERLLLPETAVHKMTGLPAQKLGLHDRGLIKPHYFADLVIFDPSTIKDQADYRDPYQYPVGIKHVIINGIEVIASGAMTGRRSGKILRKAG